jgi:hypothetical protein
MVSDDFCDGWQNAHHKIYAAIRAIPDAELLKELEK